MGDNSMGMNKCSKDTMDFAENCSLASQCYSTTQLVNYFFGNPVEVPHIDIIYKTKAQTTDAQEILNFISKDLHEGEVMNMNISNAIHRTRKNTLDSPLIWIIMGTILGLIACKLT